MSKKNAYMCANWTFLCPHWNWSLVSHRTCSPCEIGLPELQHDLFRLNWQFLCLGQEPPVSQARLLSTSPSERWPLDPQPLAPCSCLRDVRFHTETFRHQRLNDMKSALNIQLMHRGEGKPPKDTLTNTSQTKHYMLARLLVKCLAKGKKLKFTSIPPKSSKYYDSKQED